MTKYANLSGESSVVSYQTTEDSIHLVFGSGACRNYLYNHIRPGKAIVDVMKALAAQGRGLNSYVGKTVGTNFYSKW
jgi:hypothetical protein